MARSSEPLGQRDVVGREDELARLEAFLAGRDGPAAIVIEGQAGIGKTTLWRAGVEAARGMGFVALVCRPSGTDVSLAYGAIGDLIRPVVDHVLPTLPPPQRWAIEVALFIRAPEGPPPDQRAIGVAFLGILRSLARSSPLLLAIDDAQWVDPASAIVIEFALRRLEERPVKVLAAFRSNLMRGGHLQLRRALVTEDIGHLQVGPMSLGAIHRLVRARLGVVLPRPSLVRVHEASAGNPFYALELTRLLTEHGRRPDAGRHIAVPEQIEELLDARLGRLSQPVRDLLAMVAAMADPRVSMLARIAGASPAELRATLEPASTQGVIKIDSDEVHFTHPLLASSAYWRVSTDERRSLHRQLAGATSNLEERARHMALASDGPDEAVALALSAAAHQAASRGAAVTAAELADLAVSSTPPIQRVDVQRRRLELAERVLEAGDQARARALVEELMPELEHGPERADGLLLLARTRGDDIEAQTQLCRAALREAGDDAIRLARVHRRLAETAAIGMDQQAALEHARAAMHAASRTADADLHASSLAYVALFETLLGVGGSDVLEQAIELEQRAGYLPEYESPSTVMGYHLLQHDRFDDARPWLERADARALAHDDFASRLTIALHLAELEIGAGRWKRALQHAVEGYTLADELDSDHARSALLYVKARAEALLGRLDAARADASTGLDLARSSGSGIYEFHNQRVLGLIALAVEDYAEAVQWFERLMDFEGVRMRRVGFHAALPEVIEAFVGLGRLESAGQLIDLLEQSARVLGRPQLVVSAARCRGIWLAGCNDLAAAIATLQAAIETHEGHQHPFERARALLALGRIERRAKRRGDARQSLQAALAVFEELEAGPWIDQARHELARIGGRAPSTGALTATEEQVAALVAQGRSNREAAEALFVSVHTIEGHLSRIYSKLGVRSRAELAHVRSTQSVPSSEGSPT